MSKRPPLGPIPARMQCPSCHGDILTKVHHKPSIKTHVLAVLLCVFLCWPCVCVPYLVDSCQNAEHYCPNCNTYLGTYER